MTPPRSNYSKHCPLSAKTFDRMLATSAASRLRTKMLSTTSEADSRSKNTPHNQLDLYRYIQAQEGTTHHERNQIPIRRYLQCRSRYQLHFLPQQRPAR